MFIYILWQSNYYEYIGLCMQYIITRSLLHMHADYFACLSGTDPTMHLYRNQQVFYSRCLYDSVT